jgi:hypothetical protein
MQAALIGVQHQHARPMPVVGGYRAAGGPAATPTTSLKV